MGGKGPGHKSRRAWEARQRNIRKARAARKREPLPWRSGLESRVIEQLIWQWWLSVEPRKWPAYRVAREERLSKEFSSARRLFQG
jgi:hypothetical protein